MDMNVEEISAHLEIRQAIYRYCRGIDRGEIALVDSAYHPDAVDRHGPWTGAGADFGTHMVNKMDGLPTVGQHHVTNILIEIVENTANVESYVICLLPLKEEAGGGHVLLSGRYLDRFECREGRWKIAERVVIQDVTTKLSLEQWAGVTGYETGKRRELDSSAGHFWDLSG